MIAIPINNVKSAITFYKKEIEEFAEGAKDRLEDFLINPDRALNADEKLYLTNLIPIIEDLVVAEPNKLLDHKINFNKVPYRIIKKSIKVNGKGKSKKKFQKINDLTFRDQILAKLQYGTLRSEILPKYFSKIGIKSCVYCNSMLTISANSYADLNNKNNFFVKAKFQADHSISKSEFPSLSISLFNLYPVCGPCNNVKSDKDVKFDLYSSDPSLTTKSKYSFKLKKGCVTKYLLSKDPLDLILYFKDPNKLNRSIVSKGSFQDTFDIEGIYETQIDIVEELIYKAEVYNQSYKKKLAKSFQKLFTNASLSNRILVGNYTKPEDIHKRPMAKFTQDIARQLKLIK